jgi:sigma-B regulation protein RsbU (phosphoserine phosphatase)
MGFAASYRPALNIGGDFYDVIEAAPDEIYFVIGDVSGKGVPAALLMAQSVSTLRGAIKPGVSPDAVLARWNRSLCGHTVRGMFVTAIVGRIIPSLGVVEMSSAGHSSPLLVQASGSVSPTDIESTPPIGVMEDLKVPLSSVTVGKGEWLVFFTDGLIESFNAAGKMLNVDGVKRLLAMPFSSAEAVVAQVTHAEEDHRQQRSPRDDLTVLVFGFQ